MTVQLPAAAGPKQCWFAMVTLTRPTGLAPLVVVTQVAVTGSPKTQASMAGEKVTAIDEVRAPVV